MTNSAYPGKRKTPSTALPGGASFVLLIALVLALSVHPAYAQTWTVLHTFTGGSDGAYPFAGLTLDRAGNLYGSADEGGGGPCNGAGCGTVFKLTHSGSSWVFTSLYAFAGGEDGSFPNAMTFGPDGSLFGITTSGGGNGCSGEGCGTAFNLRPPAAFCRAVHCPWTENVLHRFQGYPDDGANPAGYPVFDSAGNIYGATGWGGPSGISGNVYELSPSGGGWTENILYNFTGGADGGASHSGVIFDQADNLYGATSYGGYGGFGVVFEIMPSGYGWTEQVLHLFRSETDGDNPFGGLMFDQSGNLYGTAIYNGPNNGGTVWELSPYDGTWTFTVLYAFPNQSQPLSGLVMDQAGNLYGTTYQGGNTGCFGGYGCGTVFKLSPGSGGWTYTLLHAFSGGSDGAYPTSNVRLGANGNLYGTAQYGGSGQEYNGYGVVWEITP